MIRSELVIMWTVGGRASERRYQECNSIDSSRVQGRGMIKVAELDRIFGEQTADMGSTAGGCTEHKFNNHRSNMFNWWLFLELSSTNHNLCEGWKL